MVYLLVGRYRGRIWCIYEMWPSRNQVRVEIDEEAARTVTDVFSYTEVCRHRSA